MRVTAIVLETLGIEASFVPTDGLAEIAKAKGYAHIGGDNPEAGGGNQCSVPATHSTARNTGSRNTW